MSEIITSRGVIREPAVMLRGSHWEEVAAAFLSKKDQQPKGRCIALLFAYEPFVMARKSGFHQFTAAALQINQHLSTRPDQLVSILNSTLIGPYHYPDFLRLGRVGCQPIASVQSSGCDPYRNS
jgi:hypothetical protein